MTCIVALKRGNKVYMGGDSASVDTNCLFYRQVANPKVFINDKFLIGYTSSFRMGQLLQYKARFPEPHGDLRTFMCTDFVDEVRKVLRDNGFAKIESNEESGGTFLVGVQGRIFEIQGDFQVGEYLDDYGACGCGREFALGVFYAYRNSFTSPKKIIIKALEASSHHSIGVRPPFHILEI